MLLCVEVDKGIISFGKFDLYSGEFFFPPGKPLSVQECYRVWTLIKE